MRTPSRIKNLQKGSACSIVMEVGDTAKVLDKISISDANGKDHMDFAVDNMRTEARVTT